MTLEEWINENKNTKVEFLDGKLKILEEIQYYSFLDSYGLVTNSARTSADQDDQEFLGLKAIGNYFKNEKEARRARDLLTIRSVLKNNGARSYNCDKENWAIFRSERPEPTSGKTETYDIFLAGATYEMFGLYFDTKKEAALALGKLKKLCLVEDD